MASPQKTSVSILDNTRFFFIITLTTSGLILWPGINYMPHLSLGDHGKDLYAFECVLHGMVPYRDFQWIYGPLMPYYYAPFLLCFGHYLPSILLAEILLKLLCGIMVFEIIRTLAKPAWACLAALWFLNFYPFFFYTFNHTGGILFLLLTALCLLKYISLRQDRFLYFGLSSIFLLCFVKLNFGLAALAALVFSVFLTKKILGTRPKKIFYILSFLVLPLTVAAIYFLLVHDLPVYEIRQSLPYLREEQQYKTPLSSLPSLIGFVVNNDFMASWGCLSMIFVLAAYYLTFKKRRDPSNRKTLLTLSVLLIFYAVTLHEFLIDGTAFHYHWAKPFSILIMFMSMAVVFKRSPKILPAVLSAALLLLIGRDLAQQDKYAKRFKNFDHYLFSDKGKIFIGNEPSWIVTVETTVLFLKENLKSQETFLALPYEPLYYYLTQKTSPAREVMFTEHANIPPEQERDIISRLVSKKVNWVLLSNRKTSREEGLGIFGVTYCPILAKYIKANFEVVLKLGEWNREGGWAWDHGVMILKRTKPLVSSADNLRRWNPGGL